MNARYGLVLLVSLLAAAPGCVVATQPDRGPTVVDPPSRPSLGDIDPELVGCWDWYNYRDASTGSESYRGRLDLFDDGTFAWRAYPYGASDGKGLPEYDDAGDWGVQGSSLGLYADQGPTVRRTIAFQNDALYLDGVKQFTCL